MYPTIRTENDIKIHNFHININMYKKIQTCLGKIKPPYFPFPYSFPDIFVVVGVVSFSCCQNLERWVGKRMVGGKEDNKFIQHRKRRKKERNATLHPKHVNSFDVEETMMMMTKTTTTERTCGGYKRRKVVIMLKSIIR
jgi:hypothetical protein